MSLAKKEMEVKEKERRMRSLLIESLKSEFELLDEGRDTLVVEHDQNDSTTTIIYNVGDEQVDQKRTTFYLEIKDNGCYLQDLRRGIDYRGLGHGKSLYRAVERFLIEEGCSEIEMHPTEGREKFWESLGFQHEKFGFYSKRINQRTDGKISKSA